MRSALDQLPAHNLPPRVLNVGCGAYPAARALHGARPGWALWGLDRDGAALRAARRQPMGERLPALRLVQADAIHLPGLLRARFGLVLVRHPDLRRNRAAWGQILPALGALVAPGGALLVTLYAAEEVDILRGLALPPPTPLDEGALAPVPLGGQDRYMCAYNL